MKIVIRILAFALCFGVGDLIGNAARNDYRGVEVAGIASSVIVGLLFTLLMIDYRRYNNENK